MLNVTSHNGHDPELDVFQNVKIPHIQPGQNVYNPQKDTWKNNYSKQKPRQKPHWSTSMIFFMATAITSATPNTILSLLPGPTIYATA